MGTVTNTSHVLIFPAAYVMWIHIMPTVHKRPRFSQVILLLSHF